MDVLKMITQTTSGCLTGTLQAKLVKLVDHFCQLTISTPLNILIHIEYGP